MYSLTENEKAFIALCVNYDDLASQLSDNYSNAGVAEAASLFGGSLPAGKGLVGSLTAKGVGRMDDEGHDIFWLNEEALPYIYSHIL